MHAKHIPLDEIPQLVRPPKRAKDFTGQRFGRLLALGYTKKNRIGEPLWLFRCDCGGIIEIRLYSVTRGNTSSCGCLHSEQVAERSKTHGLSHVAEFHCWSAMIDRCKNPAANWYHLYGGRGIVVCERWQNSLQNFIDDMGPRPGPEYSIDRIDNDLGYFPENCQWATAKQQANNMRTNRFIEFNGERLTISQWCEKIGIDKATLSYRLRAGWPLEKALAARKHRAKLTEEQVRRIRDLHAQGESQSHLAQQFGIAPSGVSGIVSRKTWKHTP